MLSYNFAEILLRTAEVQYTHALCDLSTLDEYRLEGNWFFLRRGDVYGAIYADNGLRITEKGPLKDKELISPGINNTWLVKVCNKKEAGEFGPFTNALRDAVEVDGARCLFRDPVYGSLEFKLMRKMELEEDELRQIFLERIGGR